MNQLIYRKATENELPQLMNLGLVAYGQYAGQLTSENWNLMHKSLISEKTYKDLFQTGECFCCLTTEGQIAGMAWLIKSGHPTEIYQNNWSYIRFVAVHPKFGGKGIGRELTKQCIHEAIVSGEHTIALHTSEIMNSARHIYESLGFSEIKDVGLRYGIRYYLFTKPLQ